jgi:hypothetical protein
MKIDPTAIIADHFGTLRDENSGKLSVVDMLIFFGLPTAALVAAWLLKFNADRDVFNISITFYGIFIALLLNIQVAIFSILQRKKDPPKDAKLSDEYLEKISLRRRLLSQVNANISYLVFFCCVALCAFLTFYAIGNPLHVAAPVAWFLYSHFILTLLMIVKRSHALFQSEYEDK